MDNKTCRQLRRYQQMATLLMLAVYLFFSMGEMVIEVMHKISHALQNSALAPHPHSHGSIVHSHGKSQHQHEVLAFFNLLITSSDQENPLEVNLKIEVDKHLIQDKSFQLSQFFNVVFKHFTLFSSHLLPKHPWVNTDPPEHLNLLIL